MPTSYLTLNLTTDHAVPVQPGGGTATVTVTSGSSVYYSTDADITPTHNEGTLVLNTPVAFTGAVWLRSAGGSTVTVRLDPTGAAGASGGMAQIYDSTLGADAASFDITSIPGTYNHLRLMGYMRGDRVSNLDTVGIRFNGDSGSNYEYQGLVVDGTAVSGEQGAVPQTRGDVGLVPAASAVANSFGIFDAMIPFYAGTVNNKACVANSFGLFTFSTGNNYRVGVRGTYWNVASAITQITLFPVVGANWKAGSRVTLYGLT